MLLNEQQRQCKCSKTFGRDCMLLTLVIFIAQCNLSYSVLTSKDIGLGIITSVFNKWHFLSSLVCSSIRRVNTLKSYGPFYA